MKNWILPAGLAMALLAPQLAFAADSTAERTVMEKAVTGFIQPAYEQFHLAATALTIETSHLCAEPSQEQRQKMDAAFRDLTSSWAHAEIVRLGPVLEKNRFERILFYPDRKSIGLKQIQALLAEPDEDVTDPLKLVGKSVAIQGIGAFEYIFYGSQADKALAEPHNYACRYGLAVAQNIEGIAETLDAAWHDPEGVAKHWMQPSDDNPVYRTYDEAIGGLIGVEVHGLEMVSDQRIGAFYKGRDLKMSPKSALLWRSNSTMPMVAANIDALAELWKVSDIATLLPEDARSLSESALFVLKSARSAATKLDQPTEERLKDEKYLGKLDFIELNLRDAIMRIDKDVSAAIGLGAGFSFSDGD